MKLKHHRFRFGLIGNLKVLLCRIFGHRVSDDPTGFTCQRCRLAYEEIYSPGYWKAMIEWMKPKPENVETKEIVSALVDELMKHTWFPSTEHQVDLFERCVPYLDIPEMPESLNHPPIFSRHGDVKDGSEATEGQTVDEYLDRLVKKATPAWQGVDPQRFMDEVRGRVPFEEALRLLRDLTDLQNGPPLETYREQWENTMVEIQDFLNAHEV